MIQLIRYRIIQSFFILITSSSHSFHLPINDTEIQSFPWLSDINYSHQHHYHQHLTNSNLISWSEIIIQIVSGELTQSSIEGTFIGDLRKVSNLLILLINFIYIKLIS